MCGVGWNLVGISIEANILLCERELSTILA